MIRLRDRHHQLEDLALIDGHPRLPVADGLDPLAQVRLDKPVRPHPVIWTDERVEAWRRDGIRPPVAVWTLRQLITFLTGVENDRLAALWWLIALRGLRRGEAAALDRDDLDSEARELTITRQLVALPGELYCGPPKSRASIRTIALDEDGTRRLVDQARPADRRAAPAPVHRPAPQRLPRPHRPRLAARDGRCSPTPTGGRSPVSWDHHWVWIVPGVAVAAAYAVRAMRASASPGPPAARPARLDRHGLDSLRLDWRRAPRWPAAGYWGLAAAMLVLYGAWPGRLWGEPHDLGLFSLGVIWQPPSTDPELYYRYGDRPWFAEYHWHGPELLTGERLPARRRPAGHPDRRRPPGPHHHEPRQPHWPHEPRQPHTSARTWS